MADIQKIRVVGTDYTLKARAVVDAGDSSEITLAYSKEGLAAEDYTWLAGWNGKELRAVAKSQFAAAGHSHPYLPLAGGTMTGSIYFSTDYTKMIGYDETHGLHMLNAGSYVGTTDSGQIVLTDAMGAKIEMNSYEVNCTSNAPSTVIGKFNIDFNELNVTGSIKTKNSVWLANAKYVRGTNTSGTIGDICGVSSNNSCYLGNSSFVTRLRGSSILMRDTQTAVTSDINLKKDITLFDERYDKFFDLLRPVGFKYIFGTSDRLHSGFIAQEVEQALAMAKLTGKDFAIIDKTPISERETIEIEVKNEDGTIETKTIDTPNSDVNYLLDKSITEEYHLRYGEMIGLLVDQVQKLKHRVDELESKIKG